MGAQTLSPSIIKILLDIMRERPSALTGELGTLKRPDGGVSTEISTTVTDPRLNEGRATNIPLLVRGVPDVQDLLAGKTATPKQMEAAIKRAQVRVMREAALLPSFDTIPQAVDAAVKRHLEEEKRVTEKKE